nr:manganese peroxidase 1 [Cyathus bulleri]
MIGRPLASGPASSSGVPSASDDVTTILTRFADVGFSPQEVVSLLAAHSIAANYLTDKPIAGAPLDSTPAIFDTQVFIEVLLRGTLFPGNGSNIGEVLSPMKGEVRLQSDFIIARDSRTACMWQSLVNNQLLMQKSFQGAFARMSLIGQNSQNFRDCSNVIPVPPPIPAAAGPHFPAGFSKGDLEQACGTTPFPPLSSDPGPSTAVTPAACWGQGTNCWRHQFPTSIIAAATTSIAGLSTSSSQVIIPTIFGLSTSNTIPVITPAIAGPPSSTVPLTTSTLGKSPTSSTPVITTTFGGPSISSTSA